jgi:hypothetical protein
MGTLTLDAKRYGRLLARSTPKLIESEKECLRALERVEALMLKGDRRTSEETALCLRQADLLPIFGSSGHASDVVNGRREISKSLARKLSAFFHVPPDLFL